MKPIMSVKEARKLLGKDAVNMTDEQINELVEQTQDLAKLSLDVARAKLVKDSIEESDYTDDGR